MFLQSRILSYFVGKKLKQVYVKQRIQLKLSKMACLETKDTDEMSENK